MVLSDDVKSLAENPGEVHLLNAGGVAVVDVSAAATTCTICAGLPPTRPTKAARDTNPKMCGDVPVTSDLHPDSTKKRDEPPLQCMDKCLTAGGWAFDVFLVVVNLTDVVSDCLIARQFWVDGHRVFFWLVIMSLAVASAIYTVVGVEILVRERLGWNGHRIPQYLGVFVVAQLIPVLAWLHETLISPTSTSHNDVAQWGSAAGRDFQTGIAAEEIGAMASSNKVMERLDVALARHFRSHALFYVESVVEAIPQSIVQLVAVSMLGEASPLQVFSLALSMISIISKGYVLSRAFGIREMCFKFVVGAFDLFSLFYIFATLVGNMSPRDVHLGGDVFVEYMSLIWLCKLGIFWGITTLISAGLGIYVLSRLSFSDFTLRNASRCLAVFLLGALCIGPAIIAIEGLKLLWANIFLTLTEPSTNLFPRMAIWYHFCRRAESDEEYWERLRYVALRFIDDKYSVEALQEVERRFRVGRASTQRMRKQQALVGLTTSTDDTVLQGSSSANTGDVSSAAGLWVDKRSRPVRRIRVDRLPLPIRAALPVLQEKPFKPWKLIHVSGFDSGTFSLPSARIEKFLLFLAFVEALVYTLGQLYSLVFPFVHYIALHGRQNLLQDFCFYGCAATLGLTLLTTPAAVGYAKFIAATRFTVRLQPVFLRSGHELETYIENYFLPPHALLLSASVSGELLPTDLVGVVAKYLKRDDLNLRDVTTEQCLELKRCMLDQMALLVDAGDDIGETAAQE